MRHPIAACIIGLAVLMAAGAMAADNLHRAARPLLLHGADEVLHGRAVTAQARTDTVYLLGGPGRLDGKFQNAAGQPDWHGWTSVDGTFMDLEAWTVTSEPELVISGAYSLWCGVEYPDEPAFPVPGFGYGNNWNEVVGYAHTVADPGLESTVTWELKLQHDTEPDYDFVHLEWLQAAQWVALESFDGASAGALEISHTFTVRPMDYSGPDADQIQLRIRFASDSAWSDEDGLHPTARGACQVDDIIVTVDGVVQSAEDFESGTLGDWVWMQQPGVGDFGALWTNLYDLDPCRTNWSSQVAFVDDGVVVPGTGGTMCITWCYGPGGYIVNNSGGLMGEGHYLDNHVVSPVLEWPAQMDDGYLVYEVYLHEELGSMDAWPGMFANWGVRSVATGDPADLEQATWHSPYINIIHGGPAYRRQQYTFGHALAGDRTHIQVRLGVLQLGHIWGWYGIDGTPAPYYDNVAVVAYAIGGPSITTLEPFLAQDSFPARPELDFVDLANNSVRFDMARNIAPPEHQINRPGDSLIVDVRAIRAGTWLADQPRMLVKLRANPLFDEVRVLPPGFTRTVGGAGDWDLIEGWVHGDSTFSPQGALISDRWNFDLPDTGFFYPGDVLHYAFEAVDNLGGVSTLPGDLGGFGDFETALAHDRNFIVRALPTMFSTTPGDQPQVLFWDDGGAAGESKWSYALRNIGLPEGHGYDRYVTRSPFSGLGNGLGGRATPAHLEGYDVLLYTSANLHHWTLSNGDFDHDAGDDIGLLDAFLSQEKHVFLGGDDLVYSLTLAGPAGQAFIDDWLGVQFVQRDLRPLIHMQTAPRVRAVPGNGMIVTMSEWIADGGCPRLSTFDALIATEAVRLAEFLNLNGDSGAFPYAAATLHSPTPPSYQRVVLFPYDFASIGHAPGTVPPAWATGKPTRALILGDIIEYFGISTYSPTATPPDAVFTASNHPNPLNPATTIALSVPHAGPVGVTVYNLRGALVRTLVDERLQAGRHEILWDGRDARGALVASGVYFYEARHGGEVKVGKMTVVK